MNSVDFFFWFEKSEKKSRRQKFNKSSKRELYSSNFVVWKQGNLNNTKKGFNRKEKKKQRNKSFKKDGENEKKKIGEVIRKIVGK